MVCFAIVACPDPALCPLTAEAKSQNSAFLFSFGRNCPEFRDFAAAVSQGSVGFRHATIAQRTILKKLQNLANSTKKELTCY